MSEKYRKKPVVIEAMQFTSENFFKCLRFITCTCSGFSTNDAESYIEIHTLEGIMTARIGDWIIKGVNGEFYPCKPDIFEKTYEPAENTRAADPAKDAMREALEYGLSRFCDPHALKTDPASQTFQRIARTALALDKNQNSFKRNLTTASEIVEKWPDWKKSLLGSDKEQE